jgi:hypothetical protein
MGKLKDPAGFIKTAHEKVSKEDKSHINSLAVQGHMEDATKRAYKWQVDNWYE